MGPPDYLGACSLQRVSAPNGRGAHSLEMDLSDVHADVVDAWLRFLYMQDDLQRIWPCSSADPDDAVTAEGFWIELLRLAQRLGDDKLFLYTQDVLVEAVTSQNWAHLATFAEQAHCRLLSEAALMLGVRLLRPMMLGAFGVQTGLDQEEAGRDQPDGGVPEPVATVGGAAAGSGGAAAHGPVDLDIERHLLGLRAATHRAELAAVLALKKGSPSQFAELKSRLAESVTAAQRAGSQLQHCMRFFDSHERRGFGRDGVVGRAQWLELGALVVLLLFFIIPSAARQAALTMLSNAAEPFRALFAFIDWGVLSPLVGGVSHIVAINVLMFLLLCLVVWSGLKGQ
mmetsp:Transcript_63551/g.182833  ORF Transcript_63551/g.182833 Transcript_63551/m.182833 type:complete len:342 (-) Transcript_63551:116-1141(-)